MFAGAHFGYGTLWGLARAAIDSGMRATGLRVPAFAAPAFAAPAFHFALVWGTALVMLPWAGAAPPVTRWGAKEVAIDVLHHVVYVAAADATYRAL
jgi:hypothetical protein